LPRTLAQQLAPRPVPWIKSHPSSSLQRLDGLADLEAKPLDSGMIALAIGPAIRLNAPPVAPKPVRPASFTRILRVTTLQRRWR